MKRAWRKGTSSVIFFEEELKEKTFENQTKFEEMARVKIEQKREERGPGGMVGLPGAKEDPVWEPTVTLPLLCLLFPTNTLTNINTHTNTSTDTITNSHTNTNTNTGKTQCLVWPESPCLDFTAILHCLPCHCSRLHCCYCTAVHALTTHQFILQRF